MRTRVHPAPQAERSTRARALAALLAAGLTSAVVVSASAVDAAAPPRIGDVPKAPTTTSRPTTTTTPETTTTAALTTTTTSAPTTTTAATTPDTTSGLGLRRAALRVSVQTTSDWIQLDLPGVSAGHLVVDGPGFGQVVPTERGIIFQGPVGIQRSVTVDVVTEVPQDVDTVSVTLRQTALGATTASVHNRTGAVYEVLTLAAQGGQVTEHVTVDALMGPTQLAWKRADDDRQVLAFTYPWFNERSVTDPRLSVHPAEPERSWDPDDARRAAQEARQHGIDGFVMSWAGATENGLALHQTLAAAVQTGGTATILLETAKAGNAVIAQRWISEALQQAASPAFLRLDGVPVVFVFDASRLTSMDWRAISMAMAASGTPVRLITDVVDGDGSVFSGGYRYNALLETERDLMTTNELADWNRSASRKLRARATLGAGSPGLVVATVQPGWDDRPIRDADRLTVPWNGVQTYDDSWSAALAGEPDWVVITSWNEWYEGTGIAPSIEHGSVALDATPAWAQRLRG